MKTWKPLLEMDDDTTGQHTCYVAETGKPDSPYVWLTQFRDGWHVETKEAYSDNYETVKICKSLNAAKRYAAFQFDLMKI